MPARPIPTILPEAGPWTRPSTRSALLLGALSKSPRLDLPETPRGRTGWTKRTQCEMWRRSLLPMKRWQEHDGCSMADSIDRACILRNQRSLERNQRSLERNRRHRMHAAAAMELCRPHRCMRRPWLSSTCRSSNQRQSEAIRGNQRLFSTCRSSTCRSKAVRLEARR